MTDIGPELSAWITDNHCSYDIAPIVELQEGDRAEVGFELNLHAELPWKGESTPELRAKATEIREKLTELVNALVPQASEKARFEIAPFRRAVRFAVSFRQPCVAGGVRSCGPPVVASSGGPQRTGGRPRGSAQTLRWTGQRYC